jgi:hypothetical protein
MSLEAIFSELRQRFKNELNGLEDHSPGLDRAEYLRWASDAKLSEAALCNAIAIHLAGGFLRGDLPFMYCDHIVNGLYSRMIEGNELPEPFWSVFLAFDAGEFADPKDPSADPVEKHTRPQLIEVMSRYSQQRFPQE